ncbi:hypothetical protein [Niveispirillum sp.]|uniref:hypothetical protein n=1 Tax=Niveispirillum sp. TaxID=1917217 RepID=UPI001B435169|nr:hypothetical protein [Niveispirillum sp.]MBP7337743.1 hypothetical protein [Niveispirillum sp.]
MWGLLRIIAVLIGVILFLTLPMVLRDSIPDTLFDAWDALLTPMRTKINGFWWQYFNRLDQQPLFQLSTLLTQALVITGVLEALRLIWRHRTA